MKSAKLLPLSHWIAFLVVGFYPLYSGEEIAYWPWIVTVAVMAVLGAGYHVMRRMRSSVHVGWWGLSLLGLDAALICFLVYYSGGITSPLFPLLFLLCATASLYDRWTKALFMAGVISAGYTAACIGNGLILADDGSRLFINVVILLGASVLLSYLAELDRREQSKAERMEALYELSSKLMEKVDLKETLHYLLSSTASFFQTDVSSVRLLDRKTGNLVLEASGAPTDELEEQIEIAVGEGFIGWVAKEKHPILVNDISRDPRFAYFPQARKQVRSALAAPILVGGELMGVLSFASTQPRVFTSEDVQMLVTISNLAASIIARAELYQIVLSRSEVIVGSMSSGLLVTDSSGKVIMANQASWDLLGLEKIPRDVSLRELLEPNLLDTDALWGYLEADVASDAESSHAHMEVRLRGTPERILSVSASPIQAGYEPNSGSVVILEDITERVKVDEIRDDLMLLIARRVEEQTALYEVGRSLIDEVDTRNLMEFLLDKAVDLVDAELGVLSLREGELFLVKAVHGMDNGTLGMTYRQGEYLPGESAASEVPLRRTEIEPAGETPWGDGIGYRLSYLAAPITWQGVTKGVIEVASPASARAFGDDDLRLLSLFVNQAAIALENSNLYRLITEDQRRMEAMLHSINDGVIAVNNEAKIILVNSAAEQILNLPPFPQTDNRHVMDVITLPELTNIFLKSLNTSMELEEEIQLGLPERRILEIETSLIETGPGERIGIIAVIRDITALRELEQAKSDFVSTVSHELRTPLTSIKAYTATLRRRDVEFEENTRQEFLQVIEEETDRLTRLVSDILDVSRIESGRLELKKRDFDLSKLVRIIIGKLQSQFPNHAIRLNSPESIDPVYADPDKIEQVFVNLVDNAAKYSPSGGEIILTLTAQSRSVKCSVKDSGVGIPHEHLPHIFEKFHRVDNRATREIYGTGLGLYVSKSIVEAHAGVIWAESELGEGSSFHFTVPLSSRAGHGGDSCGSPAQGGEVE
ncbi:MAG: GAF domain-containing protein [Actinobacteria bacterium]|jgi:two-component system phosphate regulon sensor histidine kinase PhoR|nr:MAG: GAF domain-containing protein [Actinomycetota bacterium]